MFAHLSFADQEQLVVREHAEPVVSAGDAAADDLSMLGGVPAKVLKAHAQLAVVLNVLVLLESRREHDHIA
eukprot:3065736-Alexandrium_andersonii.AAC.1